MPLRELALVEKIRTLAGEASRRSRRSGTRLGAVRHGIGDDCAVLAGSDTQDLLVTTDLCLQDIHFRLDWQSASWIGHHCLLRGLSDIAAMGGEPAAAFLSLAIPPGIRQEWIDGFFSGLLQLAKRFRVTLAGGDIGASRSGIATDIVVVGTVPKGRAILRSGAKPGDLVYVSGLLGRSADALARLRSRKTRSSSSNLQTKDIAEPRLQVGEWLRRHNKATAMIDISDGLSTDIMHICNESGVCAVLFREAIPFDRSRKRSFGERFEEDTRRYVYALHGGDDYELLFTAPRAKAVPRRIAGTEITAIGEVVARKRSTPLVTVVHGDGRVEALSGAGWEHFSSRKMAIG